MKNPNTRLIIYSTLVTVGAVLMLLGISSLLLFGMLLIVLASYFSSQKRWTGARHGPGFIFLAAAVAADFIFRWHRGNFFERESTPLWFWVVLIVGSLWTILAQFHEWRKKRSATCGLTTNHAK